MTIYDGYLFSASMWNTFASYINNKVPQILDGIMLFLPSWKKESCLCMTQLLSRIDDINQSVQSVLRQFWQNSETQVRNEFNEYFKNAALELRNWSVSDKDVDPWERWLAAVCLFHMAAKLNILPSRFDPHHFVIDEIDLFLPPANTSPPGDLATLLNNTYGMDLRYR